MQTTGIIEAIEITEGNYGPRIRINASGMWFDYPGKFPPRGVKEGDTASITFTTNDRGYHKIDKNGLRLVDANAPAVQPSGVVPYEKITAGPVAAPAPRYVDNRQEVISKQAALNTAIQYLGLQLQIGGVKFPSTAKGPDIYSTFEGMVMTEAKRLYKLNTGNEWVIAEDEEKKPVGRVASEGDDGSDDYPN